MGSLRLYFRLVGISIQSQFQYPASLAMLATGHFLMTAIDFLCLFALFERFGRVEGWTMVEVGLFYGLVHMSFALAEAVGRGFDSFDRMVRSGDFDMILLRPRSEILLLGGQELRLTRVGRFLQGAIVMGWSMKHLGLLYSPPFGIFVLWAVAGGTALFCGLFVLQATLAFWTIESLEIVNTVTYGGVETAQYPIDIYQPWFRRIFTFLIPLAFVNFIPLEGFLRFGGIGVVGWLSPAAGFVFLALSLRVWKLGVRAYSSTGS